MATLHGTDHDTDRDTIRRISALLVALGLKPEFETDDEDVLMVIADHDHGRLSCRAHNGDAGIQLAVCTTKTEEALALLTQDQYPGDLHTEPWKTPGDTLYAVWFSRTDIDTPNFLPAIAACVPLIT